MKLKEDILHIINRKSSEIRKLNDLLRKAYEELDTFTYTISHDLKTPAVFYQKLLGDHNWRIMARIFHKMQ